MSKSNPINTGSGRQGGGASKLRPFAPYTGPEKSLPSVRTKGGPSTQYSTTTGHLPGVRNGRSDPESLGNQPQGGLDETA